MSDNSTRYLHELLTNAQSKYVYFLLAAAASAIALALNRTAGEPLRYEQVPLGLAVLCWGLSFFCGCRYLAYADVGLQLNIELVLAETGEHPKIPKGRGWRDAASEQFRKLAESKGEKTRMYAARQFGFLIAGAILYIIWHVLGMALRTPGIQDSLPK